MGQQQLLLVILVTIIVGIATVVAINIFGTSAEQANEDAVRQDMATIATAAQGWFMKPTMLGGGGNSFEAIEFGVLPFSCDNIEDFEDDGEDFFICENPNGVYTISNRQEDSFDLQGDGGMTERRFTTVVARGNMADFGVGTQD